MLEKQTTVIPIPSPDVGRIIFLPETKQEFLFYIPKKISPHLKLLEGSMWFKIFNQDLGNIYRAATSLEAIYWLRDNLGQLILSPPVNKWRKLVSAVTPIPPIQNLPLFDFQRDAVG